MSGGSYDYLYRQIEDAGKRLTARNEHPYRRAFGHLLLKCADAMHDIEWVDSDDMSPGDDEEKIMMCINREDILYVCTREAIVARNELDKAINNVK